MLFTVLLVFLGGAPAVLGQPCSSLNPFIGSLPPSVLYNNPRILTSYEISILKCGHAWKQGTCCIETRLKEVARQRNQAIDQSMSDLDLNLKCIEDKLDHFKQQSASNQEISKFKNLAFLFKLSKRAVRESFIYHADQCWDHMKQVRGASLCNMCAADSLQLFAGAKAKVNKETCDQMLAKCEYFFHELLGLVRGLTGLHDDFQKMSGFKPHSDIDQLVTSLNSIANEARGNKVLAAMEEFHNKQGKDVQVEIVKTICDGLLVLNDKSFVEKISPLMTLTCRKTDEIMDGVKAFIAWKNSRSLFGRSRDLQNLEELSPPLNFDGKVPAFSSNFKTEPRISFSDSSMTDSNGKSFNSSLQMP